MGRRLTATSTAADAAAAREAIRRRFSMLTGRAGVNLGRFVGQLHAADLVEMLVNFAFDPLQPPPFRRQCALDVYYIGYPLERIGKTEEPIDTNAQGVTGETIGAEIDAARSSAAALAELDELVRRRVPVSQWPESVRLAAGKSLAMFAEIDQSET